MAMDNRFLILSDPWDHEEKKNASAFFNLLHPEWMKQREF
jgi:hypothetical protein